MTPLDWTSGPLPERARGALLAMLWRAQRDSATQNATNASNEAARTVGLASLNLTHALSAAMLATGGLHAPVEQAREVIFRRKSRTLADGEFVPGFGNSFHKDEIDPVWKELADEIRTYHANQWALIQSWSDVLKSAGKAHLPNAAALTAAVAEIVQWPEGCEAMLVILPRLMVWGEIFRKSTSGTSLA